MRQFALADTAATERLGAALSVLLKSGDVVALTGQLGAGKTTLARACIRVLCGTNTEVPSPTYTLVQTYHTPKFMLWHFDLYRLNQSDEIFELGWTETADGVAIVEWPERAGNHLPKHQLIVRMETVGDQRRAILEPLGEDWQTRLDEFDF